MKTPSQIARAALTATQSLAVAISLLALSTHAQATTYTWNGAGDPTDDTIGSPNDTNWDYTTNSQNYSNWDQGVNNANLPGNGDTVHFSSNTQSATVTLSANVGTSTQGLASLDLRTQGAGLDLESADTGTYTINLQSNATIDFGNSSGSGATQTIGSGVTLNFTGYANNYVNIQDPNYAGTPTTINGLLTGSTGYLQFSGVNVTLNNTNSTISSGEINIFNSDVSVASIQNVGVASSLGQSNFVNLNAGTLTYVGSGNGSTNQLLQIQNHSTLSDTGLGTLNWTGTITGATVGATTLLLAGTNSGVNTISGPIVNGSDGTTLAVVVTGKNTWLFNNNNNSFSGLAGGYTYGGPDDSQFSTGVAGGGTLEYTSIANSGVNSSLGAGTGDIDVGGTLAFVGTSAQSSNRNFVVYAGSYNGSNISGLIANNATSPTSSLTLSGSVYGIANQFSTLYLGGSNTGNNKFSGEILDGVGQPGLGNTSINDHMALVKTGLGTWILSNPDNSYSQGTTISQGTLIAGASSPYATPFSAQSYVGTNGSNEITTSGQPFQNGAPVVFNAFNSSELNNAPSGLNLGQIYYVVNSTNGAFQVATSPGGNPITGISSGAQFSVAQPGVFGSFDQTITMGDANTAGAPVALETNGAYTIANNINVTSYATGGATIGGIQTSGTSVYSGTVSLAQSATLTSAPGGEVDFNGPIQDASGTNTVTIAGGGVVKFTNGNSTYHGGTTVSGDLGILLIDNTSGTSPLGTGPLVVQNGGTVGGSGNASGLSSLIIGASGNGSRAQVIVGNGGSDTSTSLTLNATGASTITHANLTFNLNSNTAGQSNLLNLGSTPITFDDTTVSLNLVGNGDPFQNTYVLITDTNGWSSANGLTISGPNNEITGGLTLADFGGFGNPSQFGDSFLYVSGDNIDVEVVPEPSTWAMMLGGLASLLLFQRIRRKCKA